MTSKKITSDKEKKNRWEVWIMNILIQRMIIQKILMQPNIDHLTFQDGILVNILLQYIYG